MDKKTVRTMYLGDIILGKKISVGDPCYGVDEGTVRISNMLEGKYHVYNRIHDRGWSSVVRRLMLVHEDYEHDVDVKDDSSSAVFSSKHPHRVRGRFGVDSGMAGVFDLEYLQNSYTGNDFGPTDAPPETWSWYRKVAELTLDEKSKAFAGVMDNRCAVSSSGTGDGEYDCYAFTHTDETTGKKNVVAVLLDFSM